MPLFLLIVGAVLVLFGMGSIAAGAPDWVLGLSLGATLIQSGTIALVGGLILIALGMVLSTLQDLLKRLDAGAPPVSARAPAIAPPAARQPPAPEPAPRPREPAHDPAGDALPRQTREPSPGDERPRSRGERLREPVPEEVRVRRPASPPTIGDEQPRPRREAAPPLPPAPPGENPARPRAPRTLDQASEEIARMRREHAAGARADDGMPRSAPTPQPHGAEGRRRAPEPAAADSYQPKFRPAESAAPAANDPAADTVVRSGVIGGMAYTLYADGSIEAELPIGTVRFNSIAELQDHVTRTGEDADADFDDQQR